MSAQGTSPTPKTPKKMGRPVGSVGTPTKLSRLRANDIASSGNAPVDVMLRNMLWWHQKAEEMTEQLQLLIVGEDEGTRDEALSALRNMLHAREQSQRCAVDLAPYVHARLASVTIKGDSNHPIPVEITKDMDPKKAAEAYAATLNANKK